MKGIDGRGVKRGWDVRGRSMRGKCEVGVKGGWEVREGEV